MSIEAMKQLRDVHSIQGRDGCWDIDDYMLGLYNGLELALSIMEQRNVKYKTRKETAQPQQRTWVGLTYQEIKDGESKEELGYGFIQGALWAETKLKENNYQKGETD
jgi:hypothetical protein